MAVIQYAPPASVVRFAAAEVIRMHEAEPMVSWQTGVCAHCPPPDVDQPCLLLAWAQAIQAGRVVDPPARPRNGGRWRP